MCEHGDRRVTRMENNGTKTALATHYNVSETLITPRVLSRSRLSALCTPHIVIVHIDFLWLMPRWSRFPRYIAKLLGSNVVFMNPRDGASIARMIWCSRDAVTCTSPIHLMDYHSGLKILHSKPMDLEAFIASAGRQSQPLEQANRSQPSPNFSREVLTFSLSPCEIVGCHSFPLVHTRSYMFTNDL